MVVPSGNPMEEGPAPSALTSRTSTDSLSTSTSAEKTTVSLTKKPASRSNSEVNVTNSRQPQSLAAYVDIMVTSC